jgi:phospholipid/cholesterol/gamma-HCH transport system ATP-binding protein
MIRFEEVYKTLAGREVLKGVNLTIDCGKTHTILGPTGTGKTVTLRHIVKLLEPDAGKIFSDDKDISVFRGKELAEYKSRFGYLFQSGALIAWMTVGENVALPLIEKTNLTGNEIKKRVAEVLELVGMKDSEEMMPEALSGGMRKRVGLARAIAIKPHVLLLDEPTAGLDPIMSRKIDSVIKDLNSALKITCVIVTHDLISAFSLSDRISMLLGGRVLFDGTPDEIRKNEDPFILEFIKAQVPELQNSKN